MRIRTTPCRACVWRKGDDVVDDDDDDDGRPAGGICRRSRKRAAVSSTRYLRFLDAANKNRYTLGILVFIPTEPIFFFFFLVEFSGIYIVGLRCPPSQKKKKKLFLYSVSTVFFGSLCSR